MHASCGKILTTLVPECLAKSRVMNSYETFNKYVGDYSLISDLGNRSREWVEAISSFLCPVPVTFQPLKSTYRGQRHIILQRKEEMVTISSYIRISQSQEDLPPEEHGEQQNLPLVGMKNSHMHRNCCQTRMLMAISIALFGGTCLPFAASLTILSCSDSRMCYAAIFLLWVLSCLIERSRIFEIVTNRNYVPRLAPMLIKELRNPLRLYRHE
jgi:hypothetical protein